ncbi:unnamed protein product [Camellia sinensis]
MAAGVSRKISAASAKAHTRRPKQTTPFQLPSEATRPPPPRICGSADGPPVTAPRIKLSDGRHLISPDVSKGLGVYNVSFDRPSYGESDPNPKQTMKSLALDIEELADQLGLGSKFYLVGFSLGGQVIWTCLKYIPHSLAFQRDMPTWNWMGES